MIQVTDEELDRIKSILISEHERNWFWQPPEHNLKFHCHLDELHEFINSRHDLKKFPILVLRAPAIINGQLEEKQQSKCLILSASILQLEPETQSIWARIVLSEL